MNGKASELVASRPWCKSTTGVGSFGSYQPTQVNPTPLSRRVSRGRIEVPPTAGTVGQSGTTGGPIRPSSKYDVGMSFEDRESIRDYYDEMGDSEWNRLGETLFVVG